MAQHGLIGAGMRTSVDISYLSDCVILIRYYEAAGEFHKAISVLKKRSGPHERTIREFDLGPSVRVGAPLRQFRGVISGTPMVEPLFSNTHGSPGEE